MLRATLVAVMLIAPGCASNHTCCSKCLTWTGGILAIGAMGMIESALDPEPGPPPNTDTPENRRKMLEWESRQQEKWERDRASEYQYE